MICKADGGSCRSSTLVIIPAVRARSIMEWEFDSGELSSGEGRRLLREWAGIPGSFKLMLPSIRGDEVDGGLAPRLSPRPLVIWNALLNMRSVKAVGPRGVLDDGAWFHPLGVGHCIAGDVDVDSGLSKGFCDNVDVFPSPG